MPLSDILPAAKIGKALIKASKAGTAAMPAPPGLGRRYDSRPSEAVDGGAGSMAKADDDGTRSGSGFFANLFKGARSSDE